MSVKRVLTVITETFDISVAISVLKDVCGGMHITLKGSSLISYRSLKGILDAKWFQVETIFVHLVFAM